MPNKKICTILFVYLIKLCRSKEFQVTCETEFSELKHSITKLLCPADCWRQHSTLCGDRVYSRGPICLAAMQDQWIDGGGGPVIVYRNLGGIKRNHYSAGNRNAVSSNSCSATGNSYSFEMTCLTQGDSQHPVTEVMCPAACGKELVYGSGMYSVESSVCSAAIHAGKITERGGFVRFFGAKGQHSYIGSTSNGIESRSAESSDASFSFTNKDECADNQCMHNSTCVNGIGEYFCLCRQNYVGKNCETEIITPVSCKDVKSKGFNASGVYSLHLPYQYQGYCDMETDGGGWLVIQKRYDNSTDFYRGWDEYERGFGSLNEEFWIGLELMHKLTAWKPHELRIDLENFDSNKVYAKYSNFSIGSAETFYRVTVGGYSGNAVDYLAYHNQMPFTTKDQDHDQYSTNCAVTWIGAWWYRSCYHSNLNGKYFNKQTTDDTSNRWGPVSRKRSEIKIRPIM